MASSARIDELRKKFDENPRRYFAPLANEYRKAGDLEQAIFICEEYLPQQPGHMSGHIVYGQALFELKRHDEAKTVFETALSLDPENLIALRHLGDIARFTGDTNTARIWYQRVLEADPRNEEIAQIMLELLDAGGPPTPAVPAPAVDHSAPTPLSTPAVSSFATEREAELKTDSVAESGFDVEKSTEVAMEIASTETPEPEPVFSMPASAATPATPETPPTPARTVDEAKDDDDLLDLDSFDLGGVPLSQLRASQPVPVQSEFAEPETGEPEAQSEAQPEAAAHVESADESESAPEFDVPFEADPFAIAAAPQREREEAPEPVDASEPPGLETFEAGVVNHSEADAPSLETESFFDLPEAVPAAEREPEPEPEPEPQAEPQFEPEPAEAAESTEQAAPFVTETMATLYLQQGHLESALEIYQQLVAQRPDDEALRDRLRAVEDRMHGVTAEAPESSMAVADEPPAVAQAAQAASYGGPTIREFLGGLLGRRTPVFVEEMRPVEQAPEQQHEAAPEPGPEPEPEPEPVQQRRPTPSSVETVSGSLGVLFSGADATASDTAAASTLAEAFQPEGPETEALHGVPAHRASSELSLDHVFKNGGPQRRKEEGEDFSFDQFFADEPAEQPPAPSTPPMPSEGGDDIAQFNAWLNGLKKT